MLRLIKNSPKRLPRLATSSLRSQIQSNLVLHSGQLTATFSTSPNADTGTDKKLRANVKLLGKLLGSKIKSEDESIFHAVEKLRDFASQVLNTGRRFDRNLIRDCDHNIILYGNSGEVLMEIPPHSTKLSTRSKHMT